MGTHSVAEDLPLRVGNEIPQGHSEALETTCYQLGRGTRGSHIYQEGQPLAPPCQASWTILSEYAQFYGVNICLESP